MDPEARAPGRMRQRPRRQAREAALQVLFAADVSGALGPEAVRGCFDGVLREFSLPNRARERGLEIVVGVTSHLAEIDAALAAASRRWKVYRLATVDRNVLRIATWELLFEPDVPTEVAIDEAIEITRRFAGETSRAFVNGILDVIARSRPAARDRARIDAEDASGTSVSEPDEGAPA